MTISDLIPNAVADKISLSLIPTGITADIGKIEKGTLFFFTEGVNYDKRRLLPYILAKRPLAIVLPMWMRDICGDIPTVYTEDTRKSLAEALYRFHGLADKRMRYIAVTGTNGKTTTAMLLYRILTEEGKKCGFIGTGCILCGKQRLSTDYYSMTTPDPEQLYPTLEQMADEGCEYVVMEASSHALALEKLAPLRFAIGIFTNLSAEHLDFHKSLEEYYKTKARLFFKTELAILNTDDPYGRRLAEECPCPVLTTAALCEGDVLARNIENRGLAGSRYMYKSKGPTFFVDLKLSGLHQIYNSMAAITAAVALGIPACRARRAIERIRAVTGRMEQVARGGISVFLDYAHTPAALEAALRDARQARGEGRALWLIFGCGGERDREKRPEMARIAESGADHIILTLDNCRGESPIQILRDIRGGFSRKGAARVITNREKAIRTAILSMRERDTLIVAGKGHEKYALGKKGYRPFDERKIIADALKERKGGHTILYENQADTTDLGEKDRTDHTRI